MSESGENEQSEYSSSQENRESDSSSEYGEESDESDEEESEQDLSRATDYFFALETQHKDFVRSMVQLGENMLLTASEDKTIKIFYF